MFKIKFKHILSKYKVNQNSSNLQVLLSTCICVYLSNSEQKLVVFCQRSLQPVLRGLVHEGYFLVLLQAF